MSKKRVVKNSKYLGMIIDGWKVVDRKVVNYATCDGTHSTFTLKQKKGFSIYTITLSDREMTQVTKHGKSIEDTLGGKKYCREVLHFRVPQNTVGKRTSLFNLFRSI